MKKLVVGFVMMLAVTEVTAGLTVKDYVDARDAKDQVQFQSVIMFYLSGMMDGIHIANGVVRAVRKDLPLYCPADHIKGLSADDVTRIVSTELLRKDWKPSASLSLVLMSGLINTFPCKSDVPPR